MFVCAVGCILRETFWDIVNNSLEVQTAASLFMMEDHTLVNTILDSGDSLT